MVCSARRPELVTTCHSSQDHWLQFLAQLLPHPVPEDMKISDADLLTVGLLCVRAGGRPPGCVSVPSHPGSVRCLRSAWELTAPGWWAVDSKLLHLRRGGCYFHVARCPGGGIPEGCTKSYVTVPAPSDTRAAKSVGCTGWLYVWTVGALWCCTKLCTKSPSVCR